MVKHGNPLFTNLRGMQIGEDGMKRKKISRLLDCLSDVALEYGRRASSNCGYEEFRRALKRRFSKRKRKRKLQLQRDSYSLLIS